MPFVSSPSLYKTTPCLPPSLSAQALGPAVYSATGMFVQKLFFGLVTGVGLTSAIPASKGAPSPALRSRDGGDVDDCPGYVASNIVKTDNSLTADLTLAGDPCNAYSDDIENLKLLVEYQTGKSG